MIDDPLNKLKVKRGSQLTQSKLDEAKVIKIRKEYAHGKFLIQSLQSQYSIKGMARRYGVAPSTMEKVLACNTWTHI